MKLKIIVSLIFIVNCKLFSQTPKEYYELGNQFASQNKFDQAIEKYSKAIGLDPLFYDAIVNRGLSKAAIDDFEGAMYDLNKAITIKPKGADGYYNRANIYSSQKKYEEAIKDYSKTIELNPNEGDAYANRGLSKLMLGYENEACKDARLANDLGVDLHPEYKKLCKIE